MRTETGLTLEVLYHAALKVKILSHSSKYSAAAESILMG